MIEEPPKPTLDELLERALLEKIESVAERIAEHSRAREVMNGQEAAEFLRMSYDNFRRLAPYLPRHAVTEKRYVYLREELMRWLLER